jgi:hypothetical protein
MGIISRSGVVEIILETVRRFVGDLHRQALLIEGRLPGSLPG